MSDTQRDKKYSVEFMIYERAMLNVKFSYRTRAVQKTSKTANVAICRQDNVRMSTDFGLTTIQVGLFILNS